jgi:hypothetical protein
MCSKEGVCGWRCVQHGVIVVAPITLGCIWRMVREVLDDGVQRKKAEGA